MLSECSPEDIQALDSDPSLRDIYVEAHTTSIVPQLQRISKIFMLTRRESFSPTTLSTAMLLG